MPGFTKINLKKDAENSAKNADDVDARFGRKHLDSEHLGVSYFRYAAGFRNPSGHKHREQEEAYVVVSGSGRMRLDDEIVDLAQWDVVRVAPATVRAIEAGPDGIEIVAVGSDRPEGGDGELTADWWVD